MIIPMLLSVVVPTIAGLLIFRFIHSKKASVFVHSLPVKRSTNYISSVLAALTAPVVNTGLFLIGLSTLFTDTLYAWSGDTNVMLYIFTGLIGLNFIIEFAINAVVSPAISTVVRVATKKIINEK